LFAGLREVGSRPSISVAKNVAGAFLQAAR
jgi:hypothetical protein